MSRRIRFEAPYQVKYDAFISYSHAADGRLAPALQSALHRLAKPWYRPRMLNVFRDQTDLSASPHLWTDVQAALVEARYLILMASPDAAASKWVAREVDYWLSNKDRDKLLIALTDGELIWDAAARDFDWRHTTCLPKNLAGSFEEEPIYVDLRAFRSAEGVSASNPEFMNAVVGLAATLHGRTVGEMIGEEVRQHRRTMRIRNTVIGSLAVLLLIAVGAAWIANEQRKLADEQRREAVRQFEIASARQLASSSTLLRREIPNFIESSIALGIESMRIYPSLDADQSLRLGLALLPPIVEGLPALNSVRFSPDGQLIASDKEIWRIRPAERLASTDGTILAFTPDGENYLVLVDNHIVARNIRTGHELFSTGPLPDASVRFIDGDYLVVEPRRSDEIVVIEIHGGKQISATSVRGPQGEFRQLAFSPTGRHWLQWAFDSPSITVRDTLSGRILRRLDYTASVRAAVISDDGERVVVALTDASIDVRRLQTGATVVKLQNLASELEQIRLSADGTLLATTARNGSISVWDLDTGRLVSRMNHADSVNDLIFSADSRLLATASVDHTARVWEVASGVETVRIGSMSQVEAVAFSPDGRYLATKGSADLSHRLRDISRPWGSARWRLGDVANESYIQELSFSSNSDYLATYNMDGDAVVWRLADGAEIFSHHLEARGAAGVFDPGKNSLYIADGYRLDSYRIPEGTLLDRQEFDTGITAIGFDARGERLAIALGERRFVPLDDTANPSEVIVRDMASGQELTRLRFEQAVADLALSRNGRLLATATEDMIVRLWKIPEGSLIFESPPSGNLDAVAFSPDSRLLASASGETAIVWEIPAGLQRARITLEFGVQDVTFSKDGDFLAIGTLSESARIWDLSENREVARVNHGSPVGVVAFSPDGRHLASGSWNGVVQLSLWRPDDLVDTACSRLTHNLSEREWAMYIGDYWPYRESCSGLPQRDF